MQRYIKKPSEPHFHQSCEDSFVQARSIMFVAILILLHVQKGGKACMETGTHHIELNPGEKKVLPCCHYSSMADAKWRKQISHERSKKVNWCRKFSGMEPPPACVNYRSSPRIDLHLIAHKGHDPATYLCGKETYWNGKFVASAKITVTVKDAAATTRPPLRTSLPTENQTLSPTKSSDSDAAVIRVSDLPYNCFRNIQNVTLKVQKGYKSSPDLYVSKCLSPVKSEAQSLMWIENDFFDGTLQRNRTKRLSKCRSSKNSLACFSRRTESSVSLKIFNFDAANSKTFRCVYKSDGKKEKICQITIEVEQNED